MEFAQRGLERVPGDPDCYLILALNFGRLKQKKKVRECLEAAWNNGADEGSFHYYNAVTSGLLGDSTKMDVEILQALKHSPENAQYRCYYGMILKSKRKYKQALEQLEAALAISPNYPGALKAKAEVLTTLGRKQEAQSTGERLLQMLPDNADPHLAAGRVALYQGKVDEAISHYKEALRLNPNSEEAKTGVMNSLRSRFPLYRWYFAFNAQLARLPVGSGFVIYFVVRLVIELGVADVPIGLRIFGYATAAVVFCILFARVFLVQVSNLVLLSHPLGRLLLSKHQRAESIWMGSSIFLCVVAGIVIALSHQDTGFFLLVDAGLGCLFAGLFNFMSTTGVGRWVFFWILVALVDGGYLAGLVVAILAKR